MYDSEHRSAAGAPDEPSPPRGRPAAEGHFVSLGSFDVPGLRPGRAVTAYVPPGLPRDGTRGALYLFDGQNVFGGAGSFAGGWYAHEALDSARRRGHAVPVIVAVEHGGEGRIDELSPWKMRMGGGKLGLLLRWMVGTLLPTVQERFGLARGPSAGLLGGSSLGGLAALYGHLEHPDAFGGALCMSPSLWVAGRAIFGYVDGRPRPSASRVYLDCGGQEAGGRMLPLAEEMARRLRARGYGPDELLWVPDPEAGHNEQAWRRRLPRALRFLLKA